MKYIITKADGSPVDPKARYFVLRLDERGKMETLAARAALLHYSHIVRSIDPEASDAAFKVVAESYPAFAEKEPVETEEALISKVNKIYREGP